MQYREIKQHHLPAVISIGILFLADCLAFFLAYSLTDSLGSETVGIKYPFRILALVIFLIYISRCYDPTALRSRGQEAKTIIQLIYVIGIGYVFYKIFSKSISIDKAQYDLVFLHSFLFLDTSFRFIVRSIQRMILGNGIGMRNTILLGSGEDALHLADEISRNPSYGFRLLGYFEDEDSGSLDRYCSRLGTQDEIETYLENHTVHEMIIALEIHEHEKLLNLIGRFNAYDICMKVIPDMYESISGQVRIDTLRGLPLLDINPDIMTEFQSIMKRGMDIIISVLVLILLIPVNLVLGILIQLTSQGGIFYYQIRKGLHGREFTLYKFRTMYINSEKTTGPVWADKDDPRITPIGKVLRKFHLDEIPQLLNVLKGDMSVIGPRPERPRIINDLMEEIPYYSHRFRVKPGITGWAQIRGAYDTSLADVYNKLKNDFFYIENMSLLLDIKIIFLTVWAVIRGKGH